MQLGLARSAIDFKQLLASCHDSIGTDHTNGYHEGYGLVCWEFRSVADPSNSSTKSSRAVNLASLLHSFEESSTSTPVKQTQRTARSQRTHRPNTSSVSPKCSYIFMFAQSPSADTTPTRVDTQQLEPDRSSNTSRPMTGKQKASPLTSRSLLALSRETLKMCSRTGLLEPLLATSTAQIFLVHGKDTSISTQRQAEENARAAIEAVSRFKEGKTCLFEVLASQFGLSMRPLYHSESRSLDVQSESTKTVFSAQLLKPVVCCVKTASPSGYGVTAQCLFPQLALCFFGQPPHKTEHIPLYRHLTMQRKRAIPEPQIDHHLDKRSVRGTLHLSIPLEGTQIAPLSPKPGLALNLKGVEAVAVSDRTTRDGAKSVKQQKLDVFSDICSEITHRIFLGSDTVAKNMRKLEEKGITHIVNTAHPTCSNYHATNPTLTYKSYSLSDSAQENIDCVFYDSFEFIQEAIECGGKVFIHCVQGVSRSATIVLAYLMIHNSWSYEKAYTFVRSKRSIISPNPAFVCQLVELQHRLHAGPTTPKLYQIRPHKTGSYAVAMNVSPLPSGALMREQLNKCSDCFVLQSPVGEITIFKGPNTTPRKESLGMLHAKRLVKHEHGKHIVMVDVAQTTNYTRREMEDLPNTIVEVAREQSKHAVPRMFAFPSGEEITMFDSDDLLSDGLFLIRPAETANQQCFVWCGTNAHLSALEDVVVSHTIQEWLNEMIPSTSSVLAELCNQATQPQASLTIVREGGEAGVNGFWDTFING